MSTGWRRLAGGPPLAPGEPASTLAVALSGIALANLVFVCAAFLLYRYTPLPRGPCPRLLSPCTYRPCRLPKLLNSRRLSLTVLRDERRATVAALAFVLTPASLFMSSMYVQPPYSFPDALRRLPNPPHRLG